MSRILSMSDRVVVTIGEATFKLKPMTYLQKQEIRECTRLSGGKEVHDQLKAQVLYLKNSLRSVSGIKRFDGSDYSLEFDGDVLSDSCIDEVLNLECSDILALKAWEVLHGVKEEHLVEDQFGAKIEVQSSGK